MALPQDSIERAFARLLARVRADRTLAAEFVASRGEFFGDADLGADGGRAKEMAERRHAEWFLLERPSDGLETTPLIALDDGAVESDEATTFLDADMDSDAEDLEGGRDALAGSFASVFEITGVRAGEGVWVRDLAGAGEYPLEEADASRALEPGDLLVGRVFPVGDSLYRISHASGFFRDPHLLEAVRVDLDRARAERRGVLRTSQRELERMFFGSSGSSARTAPQDDAAQRAAAIRAARESLGQVGLDPSEVDDVLADLASEPYDPESLLPGAGDRLGAILSQLAFETDADLEALRRVLAAAWPALSAPAEPPPSSTGIPSKRHSTASAEPAAVRRALAQFDARRAQGMDLEASFRQLEQELDLDSDDDAAASEADPDSAADSDESSGALHAMIIEFLWDVERERGPAAARELAAIANFAQHAPPQVVFEDLGLRELLLYACLALPERAPNAAEARRWWRALVDFCEWTERCHDVPLARALEPLKSELETALERVATINEALRRKAGGAGGAKGPLELCAYQGDGLARDPRGDSIQVELDGSWSAALTAGDLLRVQRSTPRSSLATVLCVYPPQAAKLAEAT